MTTIDPAAVRADCERYRAWWKSAGTDRYFLSALPTAELLPIARNLLANCEALLAERDAALAEARTLNAEWESLRLTIRLNEERVKELEAALRQIHERLYRETDWTAQDAADMAAKVLAAKAGKEGG